MGWFHYQKEPKDMMQAAFNWIRSEESGQGMVEYGLLVALISVVAIVVITAIGGGLTNNFQTVLNAL